MGASLLDERLDVGPASLVELDADLVRTMAQHKTQELADSYLSLRVHELVPCGGLQRDDAVEGAILPHGGPCRSFQPGRLLTTMVAPR